MSQLDSTPVAETVKAVSAAALLMEALLELHTGLSPVDRKLLTYYALGTHAVPYVSLYPLAKLHGPPGTGKSTAARIAGLFAYRPVLLNARGCTLPAFRNKLAQAHEGTAIIEEGDTAWKGETLFEAMLSDRYERRTAHEAHNIPDGNGGFCTQQTLFFGATIIHRRIQFADHALESRGVKITFRKVVGKTFAPFDPEWETQCGQAHEAKTIEDLTFALPILEQEGSIAGRIWNTYRPVVAVARMLGDSGFEGELIHRMDVASMALSEEQSMGEVDGIVVRALIECLSDGGTLNVGKSVSLADIRNIVWKNEGVKLTSAQVGAIFGELGFAKKKSHGFIKVVASPAVLIKACAELGIEDEAVDQLAKELKSKSG